MKQPDPKQGNLKPDQENGLDDWNNRLDENLEPEDHNDPVADVKAEEFSEHFDPEDPSGEDQS